MPMSTLELRPTINYTQNTYGDNKYNVMELVRLYSQDPSQLPWQRKGGQTTITKIHSIKLPTINAMSNPSAPMTPVGFYAQQSASQPRLNLPSVGRGAAHSSMVPFSSFQKPTCGYFFTRTTEHRKMRMGIPPNFGYLCVTAPATAGM